LLLSASKCYGKHNGPMVIKQKHEYDCGPLSLIHLIKAIDPSKEWFCNVNLKISFADHLEAKYLRKLIGKWVEDCCDPGILNDKKLQNTVLKVADDGTPGTTTSESDDETCSDNKDRKPAAKRRRLAT